MKTVARRVRASVPAYTGSGVVMTQDTSQAGDARALATSRDCRTRTTTTSRKIPLMDANGVVASEHILLIPNNHPPQPT